MNLDCDHPSSDQLTAFDGGLLPPNDHAAVEQHVARCPVCCRFLERLPEDPFVARIREFAGPSTSVTTDTPLPEPGAAPVDLPDGLRGHPRYRVLGLLGAGGMGTVYRAVQLPLDRVVALKVLHRQLTDRPGFADRFRTEVKALARLNHPNVVAAYDADGAADLHFLVMEFVEGESLESLVARRGPLPVTEACDLARQAAVGLQHAHEHGLVNRDIKPANLLLTPTGVVKVADFGLARLVETAEPPEPGSAPVVLGTPEYMAPEQAREPNGADIRSDVYSLGCTLHYLLTGRPPFLGTSRLRVLLDHQDTPPPTVAGLPPAVGAVLSRLLAKDPSARFATPAEVADALARATSANLAEPPPPTAPRRRSSAFLVAGVTVTALVGGLIAFGPRNRSTESQPEGPNAPVEPAPIEPAPAEPTLHTMAIAPAPRPVNHSSLATPEQLAAGRKQAAEQMIEWVRTNNRWNPDADIAVKTAARIEEGLPKVDGFLLTFGGGLLKSGKPALVSSRSGNLFVFELTPEQAKGAKLGPMSHVFATHSRNSDLHRAAPLVRLSDLHIEDVDDHLPGARIDGAIACEFPTAPGTGDHLRITHYRPDGRRVMFLYHPKRTLPTGRVVLRFSANPLEPLTEKSNRLVILFVEWVSADGAASVIESNTAATLLLRRTAP